MTAASRITSAQLRALHSVENRQCFRTFTPSGNTLRSKDGYSPQVLWKLERLGLIREGDHLTSTQVLLALTDAGRMAKRQAETEQ
jgi:hypothetical protein